MSALDQLHVSSAEIPAVTSAAEPGADRPAAAPAADQRPEASGFPAPPDTPAALPAPVPASAPVAAPMREFLTWIAREPRTYAETMEAWRTSCPRNSLWEDAIIDGRIAIRRSEGGAMGQARVVLTPRGRAGLGGT